MRHRKYSGDVIDVKADSPSAEESTGAENSAQGSQDQPAFTPYCEVLRSSATTSSCLAKMVAKRNCAVDRGGNDIHDLAFIYGKPRPFTGTTQSKILSFYVTTAMRSWLFFKIIWEVGKNEGKLSLILTSDSHVFATKIMSMICSVCVITELA